MPNIFGEVGGDGLTNPLTENLDAAAFDIENVKKIFLDEIHDNGQGNIVIHEPLNMTNNTIGNLDDPLGQKDAVNLRYAEANFASSAVVPTTAPYDVFAAFTDETTVIPAGIPAFTLPIPRAFTCTGVRAFLTTGATTAPYYVVDIRKNGVAIPQGTGVCEFSIAGETTSSLGTFTAGNIFLSTLDRITCSVNSDATAAGLKLVLYGFVSI